jgi:hypothetical protein
MAGNAALPIIDGGLLLFKFLDYLRRERNGDGRSPHESPSGISEHFAFDGKREVRQ